MSGKTTNVPIKAFPGIAFYPHVFSLASLYRSKTTRCAIRGLLNDIFENQFNNLIISANNKRSNFISDALENKALMRKIFIEYGLPLESNDDMKTLLQLLPQYEHLPDPDQCESLLDKWQTLVQSDVDCLINKNGGASAAGANSNYDSSNENSDSEEQSTKQQSTTRRTIELVKK